MSIWNSGAFAQLRAFKAIHDEKSVVKAAQSLGLTQSAVSKQLAHLRVRFGDDLFVKTPDGMLPTPHAVRLVSRINSILAEIDALEGQPMRHPGNFKGTFRIMATDEILDRLLPRLDARLTNDAPDLRLTTLPLSGDYGARALESGQINMVIAVNWHAPDHLRQRLLFRDQFRCITHKRNVSDGQRLSREIYCNMDHVVVAPLGHDNSLIDQRLEAHGLARRVTRSVSSFGLLTPRLLGKDRIVTLPGVVAGQFATNPDLTVTSPPLDLPSIDYFALWHPRFQREERLVWMLDAIENILSLSAGEQQGNMPD